MTIIYYYNIVQVRKRFITMTIRTDSACVWKDVPPNPIRRGARSPLLYFSRQLSGPQHVIVFITTCESVASPSPFWPPRTTAVPAHQLGGGIGGPGGEFDAPDDFHYCRRAQFVRRSYTPYYYYYYYHHYTSLGQQPVCASGATRPAPYV